MKKTGNLLALLIVFIWVTCLTACWNYKEVDDMSIAAGAAIDKDKEEYLVTVEVIGIKSGKEPSKESILVEGRGETIFDAIRNIIEISGKKIYWSHAKIIIISEAIAKEGIAAPMDFFFRDSETRINLNVMISKEKTAKAIFEMENVSEDIKSFEIHKAAKNQSSVLKAPNVVLKQFINDLAAEGKSAILPTVTNTLNDNKKRTKLSGTAVFKKDKLVGYLDEEETKMLHYILNMDKGGLLVGNELSKNKETKLAIEVFKNGTITKITPQYKDGEIAMNIHVDISGAIAENGALKDFSEEEDVDKLKEGIEKAMEEKIKKLIRKVQGEYGSDIFGFGSAVKADMPGVWKTVKNNWEPLYKTLEVSVDVRMNILNKASVSKPIEIGD